MAAEPAEEELLAAGLRSENVRRHLDGKEVVKEIVVPGRLVNLVASGRGRLPLCYSSAVLVRRSARRPSRSGTALALTSSWTQASSARDTCP